MENHLSELKNIEIFMKNPSETSGKRLKDSTKSLILGWSLYCLENKKGDIVLAKNVRDTVILLLKPLVAMDRLGVKSLYEALDFLDKFPPTDDVGLEIYIFDEKSISVTKHDRNMFYIRETSDWLGVDKDLQIPANKIKKYFLQLFQEHNRLYISKIIFKMKEKLEKFYDYRLGIIWNNEKCGDCVINALEGTFYDEDKYNGDCLELIKNKCWRTFKNGPKIDENNPFLDIDEKEIIRIKREMKDRFKRKREHEPDHSDFNVQTQTDNNWYCKQCLLQNKGNVNKCIACEADKD